MLCSSTLVAAGAVAAQEPRGAAFRLARAELEVAPGSALAAHVRARYEIEGDGNLPLLLAWFPGQTLSELRVEVNGTEVVADFTGDDRDESGAGVRRAEVSLATRGSHEIVVEYRVASSDAFAFRFPLVVPAAVPDAAARSVDLTVDLPAGSHFTGDGFPNLSASASGSRLRARMVSVPAFAQVVFTEQPTVMGFALRLEIVVILVVLVPVTAVLLRWWWREGVA